MNDKANLPKTYATHPANATTRVASAASQSRTIPPGPSHQHHGAAGDFLHRLHLHHPRFALPFHLNESLLMSSLTPFISKFLSAPFRRPIVLLQTQPDLLRTGRVLKPYQHTFNIIPRLMEEEGSFGPWRGLSAAFIRISVNHVLAHPLRNMALSLRHTFTSDRVSHGILSNIFWGSLSGSLMMTALYPLETAETLLMTDVAPHKYSGILDVLQQVYAESGIMGFFRGIGAAFFGVVAFRGIYFGIFDVAIMALGNHIHNPWVSYSAGWAAAIASELLTYPFEVVRRRAILNDRPSWDMFTTMMREEGLPAFYRGYPDTVLQSVLRAALIAGLDALLLKA